MEVDVGMTRHVRGRMGLEMEGMNWWAEGGCACGTC